MVVLAVFPTVANADFSFLSFKKTLTYWLRWVLLAARRVSTFLAAGRIVTCSRWNLVP